MKVQGFFEKVWEQKKEGSQWVNIYGEFSVKGERDLIKVSIPHTKEWCLEHGLKTGASGEANISFRKEKSKDETYEFYTQKVWDWKTQEQLMKEEEEKSDRKAKAEQKPVPMEKTAEMVAAAEQKVQEAQNDPEAGSELPF